MPLSKQGIIESHASSPFSPQNIAADSNRVASAGSSIARLQTFKKRSDFVRMNKSADYIAKHGFVIQYLAKQSAIEADSAIRIGYTASKKIGNAVIRNKSKRRLRQLARAHLPQLANKNMDYVLIARKETPHVNFAEMQQKFTHAINSIPTKNN